MAKNKIHLLKNIRYIINNSSGGYLSRYNKVIDSTSIKDYYLSNVNSIPLKIGYLGSESELEYTKYNFEFTIDYSKISNNSNYSSLFDLLFITDKHNNVVAYIELSSYVDYSVIINNFKLVLSIKIYDNLGIQVDVNQEVSEIGYYSSIDQDNVDFDYRSLTPNYIDSLVDLRLKPKLGKFSYESDYGVSLFDFIYKIDVNVDDDLVKVKFITDINSYSEEYKQLMLYVLTKDNLNIYKVIRDKDFTDPNDKSDPLVLTTMPKLSPYKEIKLPDNLKKTISEPSYDVGLFLNGILTRNNSSFSLYLFENNSENNIKLAEVSCNNYRIFNNKIFPSYDSINLLDIPELIILNTYTNINIKLSKFYFISSNMIIHEYNNQLLLEVYQILKDNKIKRYYTKLDSSIYSNIIAEQVSFDTIIIYDKDNKIHIFTAEFDNESGSIYELSNPDSILRYVSDCKMTNLTIKTGDIPNLILFDSMWYVMRGKTLYLI